MAVNTDSYMKQYLNKSFSVANTPYQAYSGQTVAQFDPYQKQAISGQAQRAANGSPLVDQAKDFTSGVMGGQYNVQPGQSTVAQNPYMGANNPYLQDSISNAQNDVVQSYNLTQAPADVASARRSGSFGNSGLAEANAYNQSNLQKNLGNISTNMRMQDYTQQQQLAESDVGRQFAANQSDLTRSNDAQKFNSTLGMTAANQSVGLANNDYTDLNQLYNAGTLNQTQNQTNLTDKYNQWATKQNYPLNQAQIMGAALGNTGSNAQLYQQQQQYNDQNQANSGANSVGYGLLGAQLGNAIGGSFGYGGLGAAAGGLLGYLAG